MYKNDILRTSSELVKTLRSHLKSDLELEVKNKLVLRQDIHIIITTFVKNLNGYNDIADRDYYKSVDSKENPVKGAVLVDTFASKVSWMMQMHFHSIWFFCQSSCESTQPE